VQGPAGGQQFVGQAGPHAVPVGQQYGLSTEVPPHALVFIDPFAHMQTLVPVKYWVTFAACAHWPISISVAGVKPLGHWLPGFVA
jgi:hypothetical protein